MSDLFFGLGLGFIVAFIILKRKRKELNLEELMRRAGQFAVIRWSPAAHDLGVNQKWIYLLNQGYIMDSFPLSRAKVEELEGYDIPVLDETAGSEYPDSYEKPAPSETILSRWRLGQWI